MLRFMPFFLEYVTDKSTGWLAVEGISVNDALTKAKSALRGLDCTSAVVRYTPNNESVLGGGPVVAAYNKAEGWRLTRPWMPLHR